MRATIYLTSSTIRRLNSGGPYFSASCMSLAASAASIAKEAAVPAPGNIEAVPEAIYPAAPLQSPW